MLRRSGKRVAFFESYNVVDKMLGLITVLVVMVVSAECTGETDDTRTTRYERHRDLGGLFFSKNLILETSARSRVECATRCQVRQGCAAFTFSPVWGTCRQHKCFSTSLSPSYNSPGAETSSRKCLASGHRLSDFDVHIINSAGEETLCYHYTGAMRQGATETLYCPEPVVGRYVRIRKPAGVLSLCEVQVLGPN
ncbi:hypothetical protein BaRGS_00038140 [Batillaria attramentaria]|uniref:Apple domain-containing protein n=1 Tax=Batillaria attramentaria TaxID=370345 RepID=A0ABD0J6P9_9CAEN